ncbi:MAG TPA: ORF6N domain-containing protein [Polyangia bacterium]|jgi:ORF6N domain.|nr:ORF6N domain-containing protein [Polyangia bacterium]
MVEKSLVPLEHVERVILVLRGQKVLLDSDLAALYGVPVKALNQAVKRNLARFPEDFMFQLTLEEVRRSRSQSVTLKSLGPAAGRPSRSQSVILKRGTNIKYLPYAFTEQGVAMLSSVLSSPRAVHVNIEIMRAFVRLRQMLQQNTELARKLAALERKYDGQFKMVFEAIRDLMTPTPKEKPRIGFRKGGS